MQRQREVHFFFLFNPFTPHVSFAQWNRPNRSIEQHNARKFMWGRRKRIEQNLLLKAVMDASFQHKNGKEGSPQNCCDSSVMLNNREENKKNQ